MLRKKGCCNINFVSVPGGAQNFIGTAAFPGTGATGILAGMERSPVEGDEWVDPIDGLRYIFDGDVWELEPCNGIMQGDGTNTLNLLPCNEGLPAGDTRGENSVDLQTIRANANQVAGGVASSIVGGQNNRIFITGTDSSILGGTTNAVSGEQSSIVGGSNNTLVTPSVNSVILAGTLNQISGNQSAVISGSNNSVSESNNSTILGGSNNTISTLPAGSANNSVGGGQLASIFHDNSFVWSDGTSFTTSFAANTFVVKSTGGVIFYSNAGQTTGVNLVSGSNAWAGVSDRNKKENIIQLNYDEILEKVNLLPIYEYNFKETDPNLKCRGPMAQDWHELFPSGKDPLKIDTMDLDGISFAAIKGLLQKVEKLEEKIRELEN